MNNIRHIHDVLDMIGRTGAEHTTGSLIDEIKEIYGEDVHFTSCADHVFPIQGVIPFLVDRGKIRVENERIIVLTATCNH
jgi:probable metal-binding protein